MPQGPGKYDAECTAVREQLNADGVVLLVHRGDRGSGFSVQLGAEALRGLPRVLRELADEIERETPMDLN